MMDNWKEGWSQNLEISEAAHAHQQTLSRGHQTLFRVQVHCVPLQLNPDEFLHSSFLVLWL